MWRMNTTQTTLLREMDGIVPETLEEKAIGLLVTRGLMIVGSISLRDILSPHEARVIGSSKNALETGQIILIRNLRRVILKDRTDHVNRISQRGTIDRIVQKEANVLIDRIEMNALAVADLQGMTNMITLGDTVGMIIPV